MKVSTLLKEGSRQGAKGKVKVAKEPAKPEGKLWEGVPPSPITAAQLLLRVHQLLKKGPVSKGDLKAKMATLGVAWTSPQGQAIVAFLRDVARSLVEEE